MGGGGWGCGCEGRSGGGGGGGGEGGGGKGGSDGGAAVSGTSVVEYSVIASTASVPFARFVLWVVVVVAVVERGRLTFLLRRSPLIIRTDLDFLVLPK